MREIKFRAWDKENKKMVDFDKVCLMRNNENSLVTLGSHGCFKEDEKDFKKRIGKKTYIFMQYTGLKDRNGEGGK